MLIFWLIFLVVFVGTLIIFAAIFHTKETNIRKRQDSINLKAIEAIKKSNFQPTKTYFIKDYSTYNQSNNCQKFLAVNNEKRQMCLIDYDKGSLLFVNFEDFLNYEIYENGGTATSGGAAGGLGLGVFGASTDGVCKDLKLIIRLKKLDSPQVTYDIISNTCLNFGVNKSTEPYRQCVSSLQEVVSFLEVLKNENAAKKE